MDRNKWTACATVKLRHSELTVVRKALRCSEKSLIVSLTTSHSPNDPKILTLHYFIDQLQLFVRSKKRRFTSTALMRKLSKLAAPHSLVLTVITVRRAVTVLCHPAVTLKISTSSHNLSIWLSTAIAFPNSYTLPRIVLKPPCLFFAM